MANERNPNHDSGGESGSKDTGKSFNLYGDNFAEQDVQENEASEFEALDQTLDQLDSCLSMLEERNDNLNAKLRDLLDSNKKARDEPKEPEMKNDS